MNKLLTISFFALVASLAHAGSCGDDQGKDKKGEKASFSEPSVVMACDKAGSGDEKKGADKARLSAASIELAGSCGGDRKTDKDDKPGKASFSSQAQAIV